MAKGNFGIASSLGKDFKKVIKDEPVTEKEELKAIENVEETPVEKAEIKPAPEKNKGGRPRKTSANEEARTAFVRTTLSPSLKKKLKMVCMMKGVSEDAYTYELLEKAIRKDYEKFVASEEI